jgi:hypothetical protein
MPDQSTINMTRINAGRVDPGVRENGSRSIKIAAKVHSINSIQT